MYMISWSVKMGFWNFGWLKRLLVPAGIEPATLSVWRTRDNHYTKEPFCIIAAKMFDFDVNCCTIWMRKSSTRVIWSRGATDNASDYGSEDCRFESCRDRHNFCYISFTSQSAENKRRAPPGGLEPPTFRLTAERASRLRHGGIWRKGFNQKICIQAHFIRWYKVES